MFGCRHASIFRPPQLPPNVRQAFERSAEAITSNSNQDNTQHHHRYYYTEAQPPPKQQQQLQPKSSTDGYIESRKDAIHKARAGEILVKDSVLYNNETPAVSQLVQKPKLTQQQQLQLQLRLQQQQQQMQLMGATIRRNYWPQIDNAVTSITSKAAAAGQAVKNLLKVGFFSTFDNVNAAVEHKKHKIASYLIQAAQEHKFALQQAKEQEQYKQQLKLAAATLGGGIGPAGNGNGIGSGVVGATGLLGSAIGGGVGIGAGPIATGVGAAVAAAVSGVTQHIPLNNQPSLLPLAKPLHSLIPLKQQLAKNVIQHFAKHLKKPIKKPLIAPPWIVYSKTKTLPTTTVSEGYIHTFDNKYMPPNFGPPNERNPYADMGVTSYKHFEDTILRELEEKEERKVEATMHTLFDDQYVVKETLEGTKPGSSQEWTPTFNSHDSNGLFVSKPITSFTQSSFDRPYLDVRPVVENTDEVPPAQPTLFVFPAHADANELQEASNQHSVTITAADAKTPLNGTTAANSTTTEKPNYPAYFIKQQQELRKLQQKLVRSKSVYGNKVSDVATSTTVSPKSTAHMKRNRGKSPYGRKSPTKTTSSTTSSTTISPTTLAPPTTTSTTVSPIFFFNMNGTDDGFQPMMPSEIKAMKIKKPTDLRIKLQNSGVNGAIRQRSSTSSPIQAQASHVHISVVSAPDTSKSTSSSSSRAKWTAGSRNSNHDMKGSSTRHAPKKALKSPTAASTNATTNANQKRNRGTIKFSDSLHQPQTS